MAIKKHLPVLDGIRGLAALMVMTFHYLENDAHILDHGFHQFLHKFSTVGQTGVDLFFVLSGFLITRILLGAKSKEKFFSTFYARRAIRIWPLYYFFLVLTLFLLPILAGDAIQSFDQHWYWWAHLQNLPLAYGWDWGGPQIYWSLAIEEHFYLVWPLLVYMLSRRQLAVTSVVLVLGSLALRPLMLSWGVDVFYFTLTRFDALCLGALLAILEPALLTQSTANRRLFSSLLAITFIPLLLTYTVMAGSGAAWIQVVKYPLIGLVYVSLMGVAINSTDSSVFRRVFESWPLCFLGSISYGLYLYHSLCFEWFDQLVSNDYPLLMMPLAFLFSAAVAYASFHLFEKPFLSLKRFFKYPQAAPAAALSAPAVMAGSNVGRQSSR